MGRDVVLQERVDQPTVEIDAFLVHRPASVRHDPRPSDAEAIVLDAEVGHQLHIVLIAVIVIAGDVARVAAVGAARGVAEGVPDARLAAVFRRGAFDLVGRGGRSPPETLGEPDLRRFRRSGCALRRLADAGEHCGGRAESGPGDEISSLHDKDLLL